MSRKFSFYRVPQEKLDPLQETDQSEMDLEEYNQLRKQQVMETMFLDVKNPYRM
jgi:hypothetical protein